MAINRNLGIAACVIALLLLVVAAISGNASASASTNPTVSGAWLRLPIVAGRPAAGYATITGGEVADRLIAVEGPKATRLELHAVRNDNGVMRMTPVEGIPVAAGGKVELQPGGLHIMVFGLPKTKPDTYVPLTFVFEKAGRISVSAHAMSQDQGVHSHH